METSITTTQLLDASDSIIVSDTVSIPLTEIAISFSRSSGPGGQHVNKTSTQAELTFDLEHSPSIPESDRVWLRKQLASKLDSAGVLRVTSQEYRSQLRNKNAAIDKLQSMLQAAMLRPKKRKRTKPSRAAVERRLSSKKKSGEKKKLRQEKW